MRRRAVAGIGQEAVGREAPPRRAISRSRTTLATMEAAAIEAMRASPLTIASTGQGSRGGSLPSTRAMSGVQGRAASARHMARSDAWRMLMASISLCEIDAMPTCAVARILSNRASRSSASGPSNRRGPPAPASGRARPPPRPPARRAARARPRRVRRRSRPAAHERARARDRAQMRGRRIASWRGSTARIAARFTPARSCRLIDSRNPHPPLSSRKPAQRLSGTHGPAHERGSRLSASLRPGCRGFDRQNRLNCPFPSRRRREQIRAQLPAARLMPRRAVACSKRRPIIQA